MLYKGILKRISIKNNDTDSYLTLNIEVNNNNDIDINYLNNLKHKYLNIDIKEVLKEY